MEPIGIADPEQLAALTQALDRYCDARHITNEQDRENLAYLIMDLFGRGLTSVEEIVSALEEMGSRNERRRALAQFAPPPSKSLLPRRRWAHDRDVLPLRCGQADVVPSAANADVLYSSLCRRIGAVWGYYRSAEVNIEAAAGATVAYIQGDRTLAMHHCAVGGCITHWQSLPSGEDRVGVNFRLANPVAIADVRVRHLDGADTWTYLD